MYQGADRGGGGYIGGGELWGDEFYALHAQENKGCGLCGLRSCLFTITILLIGVLIWVGLVA